MKKTSITLTVCLTALLSCSRDESPALLTRTEIGFNLTEQLEWQATRGISVNEANIQSVYADNVGVTAFLAGEGSEYIPQQTLFQPNVSDNLWHTSDRYYWPENGSLTFWAWAPLNLPAGQGSGFTPAFSDEGNVMSFNYSMQAPDPVAKADALAQPDLVIARTNADRNTQNGGVTLTFSHPLASIIFTAGDVRDGIIRSISLKNIKGSGECVFDGNSFTWAASGSLQTYTQTFDAAVNEGQSGQPVTLAGEPLGKRTFMVIPQELGTDAAIEVVFDDGTEVTTLSHPLSSTVWAAGRSYNYRISLTPAYPDGYGISVEEIFNGYIKSHVSMKNNTDKNLYIRAAIVANWVDAEGNIVAPCDIHREGVMIDLNILSIGGRWTRHSDGFLYYKKAIRPGRSTWNLFTSYVPGLPPVPGSRLEMTILVQGVEYDRNMKLAEMAWGPNLPLAGSLE